MRKKSRNYIGILLGGHPASLDKAIELVADQNKHLRFIYGFGVFVIYFSSRKNLKEIEGVFKTQWLKREVDMIFVFPDSKKVITEIRPDIKEKLNFNHQTEKIINGDLNILRDILNMMSTKYNMRPPNMPMQNVDDTMEYVEEIPSEPNDHDILNQLLDKMKKEGYNSLTSAELDFIREYKEKYRKKDESDEQLD